MGRKIFGQKAFDQLMERTKAWIPENGILLNLSSAAFVLSFTESDVLKIPESDLPRHPMIIGSRQWGWGYRREDCVDYMLDSYEKSYLAKERQRRAERRAKKRLEEQMKQSNKEQ